MMNDREMMSLLTGSLDVSVQRWRIRVEKWSGQHGLPYIMPTALSTQ